MVDLTVTRRYFQLFNSALRPLFLSEGDFDYALLAQSGSVVHQLQSYSILASMYYNFGGSPSLCLDYEHRARRAAMELLDEFTLEAAKGFHLLAFHYWGRNNDKAEHYRCISLSISRRVLARGDADQEKATRLYLSTLAISEIYEPSLMSDYDLLFQHQPRAGGSRPSQRVEILPQRVLLPFRANITQNTELSTEELHFYIRFRVEISSSLLKSSGVRGENPLRGIDPDTFQRLSDMLQETVHIMGRHHVKHPYPILHQVVGPLLFGILYCAGFRHLSLSSIHQALLILESNQSIIAHMNPFVISVLQMAFFVSYHQSDYHLAHRIVNQQKALANIWPFVHQQVTSNLLMLEILSIPTPLSHGSLPNRVSAGQAPSVYPETASYPSNSFKDELFELEGANSHTSPCWSTFESPPAPYPSISNVQPQSSWSTFESPPAPSPSIFNVQPQSPWPTFDSPPARSPSTPNAQPQRSNQTSFLWNSIDKKPANPNRPEESPFPGIPFELSG